MRPLSTALAFACAVALTLCLLLRADYFLGSALTVARWPLVVALVLLAARLRGRAGLVTLAFAAAGVFDYVVIRPARAEPSLLPRRTTTLNVVTHNVLFKGARPTESLGMLGAQAADLVALQEVTSAWEAKLDAELLPRLPHKAARAHPGANGYAVYSRYPLSNVTYLASFAQCFTLELPGRHVPVCNVHLSSPAGALLMRGLRRVRELEANAARREKEWQQVDAWFGDARHRLVLGDLNTLEVEPLYGTISETWVDAFRAASSGPGATWPNHFGRLIPFARIDYVLTQGAIEPRASTVPKRSGSDHLAVTAELTLAASP